MSSDHKPAPRRRDLAVLQADDLLLDALGSGEPAPADDEIAALLAAWRSDLDDASDGGGAKATDTAPVIPINRARRARRARLPATPAVGAPPAGRPAGAAPHARPGSPLWPA